jgi:hypothetical protein
MTRDEVARMNEDETYSATVNAAWESYKTSKAHAEVAYDTIAALAKEAYLLRNNSKKVQP